MNSFLTDASKLLLATAVFLVGTPDLASSQCRVDPDDDGITSSDLIDRFHPRHFVRVTEVTHDRRRIPVLVQKSASRDVELSPVHEVDRRSNLHISFDREWMAQQESFDANILLTGRLFHDDKEQDLQIPGYHQIGTQSDTNSVAVASSDEMCFLLNELTLPTGVLARTISSLAASQRMASIADRELGNLLDLQRVLRTEVARLAAPSDSSNQYRAIAHYTVTDSQQVVQDRLAQVTRALEQHPQAQQYANAAAADLRSTSDQLRSALGRLASPQNTKVLRSIGRVSGRDPQWVANTALWVAQRIKALSEAPDLNAGTPSDQIRARYILLGEVKQGLEEVRSFSISALPAVAETSRVNLLLLGDLKDADLLLANTVATAGDEIALTVHNFRNEPSRSRSVDMRLHVREFGWVRKISDSYMFFYRAGLDEAYRAARAADSVEVDNRARTTGEQAEFTRVTPMNFEPALGVTLGWTYYHRDRGSRTARMVRWLEPGLGMNVSFPRFASRRFTVTRSDTNPTTPLQRKVTEEKQQIGLSSGIILSAFDGALQYSYGYSLVTQNKRRYHSVGFSFFEVAKRLAESARN